MTFFGFLDAVRIDFFTDFFAPFFAADDFFVDNDVFRTFFDDEERDACVLAIEKRREKRDNPT